MTVGWWSHDQFQEPIKSVDGGNHGVCIFWHWLQLVVFSASIFVTNHILGYSINSHWWVLVNKLISPSVTYFFSMLFHHFCVNSCKLEGLGLPTLLLCQTMTDVWIGQTHIILYYMFLTHEHLPLSKWPDHWIGINPREQFSVSGLYSDVSLYSPKIYKTT